MKQPSEILKMSVDEQNTYFSKQKKIFDIIMLYNLVIPDGDKYYTQWKRPIKVSTTILTNDLKEYSYNEVVEAIEYYVGGPTAIAYESHTEIETEGCKYYIINAGYYSNVGA